MQPTDKERTEALIRRTLSDGWARHFISVLDHNARCWDHLRQVIEAARAEAYEQGQAAWAGGEVRTEIKDGVIRQSVMAQATETTSTTITVGASMIAPEPEGEGLYDIPVTWTCHDTWSIRAGSSTEALEIARDGGFDAAEEHTHDEYPTATYGAPLLRKD